jgi:hypothetical protein
MTNPNMTESEARELGTRHGREAIDTLCNEDGMQAVRDFLQAGEFDEAAINGNAADAAGVPESEERAYYLAYARAAESEAEELLAEPE